ncbi:MAG: hypothetical protein KA004_15725 [Verrucomicrobiales bacterium]|nr:hypothetical protein [Verrucomicrobiales bacterium]
MAPPFLRLLPAMLLLGALPVLADKNAPAPPPAFRPVEVTDAWFTQEKVGIFQVELEKTATYLAIFVHRNFTPAVRKGNTEARLYARRYLSLALHVDPHNAAAQKVNRWLAEGTEVAEDIPLPQDEKHFVEAVVRLNRQLAARPEPAAKRLRGFLSLVAADLDPKNEEAVYEAELFRREEKNLMQAWKDLAQGRKLPASATP